MSFCVRVSESCNSFIVFQVSNRRSRRLINDRILLELVPRLSGDEIRGLFAPPPWGKPLYALHNDIVEMNQASFAV